MMKKTLKITLISVQFLITITLYAQSNFKWPDTPASKTFQGFVKAYNSGNKIEFESFIKNHYTKTDKAYVERVTEYWMDYYYRFGSVKPYELSINKPDDLEVWLQGEVSKTWFAPEFLLNSDSKKIRATGMLLGDQPPNTTTPSSNKKDFIKKINGYLESNDKHNLFQGVVLIAQKSKILINKAYGFKDIEQNIKNQLDTRFQFVSVTKPITTIACLQLVQKGLLELHQPISKYLPDLPKHIADKITVHHLITHTSGYELDDIEGFRKELSLTSSMSEVYQTQLKYLPKWEFYNDFKLPKRWDYANDSYDLLGIIIEKLSNMKFEDYLKKNIFDIAGMTNTSFSAKGEANPYRYDLIEDGLKGHKSYPKSWGKISGAAALVGTVDDLRKLFNTIKNTNRILDLPHKNLLCSPLVSRGNKEFESLGLNISYNIALNFGHAGTSVGNTAEVRYFPESDLLFIALCNNRSGASNLYNFVRNNLWIENNSSK